MENKSFRDKVWEEAEGIADEYFNSYFKDLNEFEQNAIYQYVFNKSIKENSKVSGGKDEN